MKYLSAILLVCTAMASQAQRIELGFFGGGSFYMGDINPERPFELTQPAFGFVYRYNFHNRIALKASLTRGKVMGDDLITKYREERGINFESNINELAAVMEFNFLEYFTGSSHNFITPYIFGGLGVFTYNPKATYYGETFDLATLNTEGVNYSLFESGGTAMAVSFPFGIGVKYSVNNVIGITAEWGMRKTSTDYLDDISRTYQYNFDFNSIGSGNIVLGNPVDQSEWNIWNSSHKITDPTGSMQTITFIVNPGEPVPNEEIRDIYVPTFINSMQRGNSKDNDWYSFAGVSVIFRINFRGSARCDEPDRMRL